MLLKVIHFYSSSSLFLEKILPSSKIALESLPFSKWGKGITANSCVSALFQMKCCGTIWLGKGVILSNELDCEPDVLRAHEEYKFFSFTGGGSNLIFIICWEQNLWNPRTGMLARSTTICVTIWQSTWAVGKGVVINGKKFDSALCLHQVKPNFRLLHKTLQVKMKLENGACNVVPNPNPFFKQQNW